MSAINVIMSQEEFQAAIDANTKETVTKTIELLSENGMFAQELPLSADEVGKHFGVSGRSVKEWVAKFGFPVSEKLPKQVFFWSEINAWLKGNEAPIKLKEKLKKAA